MKHRVGVSPILVEMVFVLLFFSLSAAVIVQLLGASSILSQRSAEKSGALLAAENAMEQLLSDPVALSRGDARVSDGAYTLSLRVTPAPQSNGVFYTVDCAALKNEKTILSLQGGRFVGSSVTP
ncbi:MAG: hypothetical protein PHC80_02880 [Eubacteriales bacterium]|nr:hypothetical protein [Eubacteriales bacterium]